MPVPSTINDLSTTAGANYPAGTESPSTIDDYLRAHASFIATLRDGKVGDTGDETIAGIKTFSSTIVGNISGNAGTATSATTATNLAGGSAGTLPYQTGSGATAQLAAGTSGYVLRCNGAAAPSWTAQSAIDAGSVDGKSFGTFGAAGGILYATSTSDASATVAGTSGQVLLSGGAGAPTWAAQSSLSVGSATTATSATSATTATNIAGGSAGAVPYQSGAGSTALLAAGTSGQVLQSNGAGAPSWVNQSSLAVGSATTAGNVSGTVAIANGGTGQTTASGAFSALKQDATTSATGVVELATTAEAQAGTDSVRAITPQTLQAAKLVFGTSQNTTSGTFIDFTGIPSWARRVTVMLNGVSTNGSSTILIQVGSGSVQTTGYNGVGVGFAGVGIASNGYTTGFGLEDGSDPSFARHGTFVLTHTGSGNAWVAMGNLFRATNSGGMTAGGVSLSGALDRVRLTTLGGVDTFDAGSVNIVWE